MMKFICPRCREVSVGRQWHADCFETVHRETAIIKNAQKKQARDRVDADLSRSQSLIVKSKKRAAVQRGVNPRSYDEIENAEAFWTGMMKGRSFG